MNISFAFARVLVPVLVLVPDLALEFVLALTFVFALVFTFTVSPHAFYLTL